jgi:Protein of unknown function (DUF3047)
MPGAAASLLLAGAAAALAPLLAGPADAPQLAPGWRVATLPRQTLPVTRFTAERGAVRIDAADSYGNLVFDLALAEAPRRLRWSWRVQRPNGAADLRSKSGDDAPAKVCLSFDLPLEQLPFGERTRLRFFRASAGEHLPAATLCWVWGRTEARETLLDSPYTRRVRYIVVRNAADGGDGWHDETRDVAADFLRAFGDEAQTLPPLVAVLIGGDADNTHQQTQAHVAELRFEP